MGIVVKQSIRNSIFLFSGVGLGALNVLILFPLFLSTEVFGLTKILLDIAVLGGSVASLGMPTVFVKYMPKFRSKDKSEPGLLRFVLKISAIGIIIITGLFLIFKSNILGYYTSKSAMLGEYFYLVVPIMVFVVLNGIFTEYCKSLLKSVYPTFVNELFLRILTTLILVLVGLQLINADTFVNTYAISVGFGSIAFVTYLVYLKEFNLSTFNKGQTEPLSSYYKYGSANLLTGLSRSLATRLDSVMIIALLPVGFLFDDPLEAVGVYGFSIYVSTLIQIPGRGITSIAVPLVAKAWENNDLSTIKDIYKKSALNQLIFGGFVFIVLILNLDNLILLLPKFELARWPIIWLSLSSLVNVSFGVNTGIIITSKYYLVATASLVLLSILVVLGNLFMIPLFGIEGAAIATFGATFIVQVASFIYVWAKFKLQPFNAKNLIVFSILGICGGLIYLIPDFSNTFINIVIKSGAFLILYFFIIVTSKLSPDINLLLNNVLSKVGLDKNS
jgi:O-antigen/teichoic acid export membrane protein